MGAKLYSAFVGAGVPPPSLSLDAGIWGGEDNPAAMATELIRRLLPVVEKSGIATEAQMEITSLQESIQLEMAYPGAPRQNEPGQLQ